MNKQNRDITVDIYKGIAIVLVLFGHGKLPTFLYSLIFSFHLALFFIEKGFFMPFQVEKYSFLTYFKKNVLRLIVPYLLILGFNFLTLLMRKFLIGDYTNIHYLPVNLLKVIVYGNHSYFEYYGYYTYLWFVPLFFLYSNIFFLLQKYTKKVFWPLYLMLGLFITFDYFSIFKLLEYVYFWEIDKVPLVLFLGMTGLMLYKKREVINKLPTALFVLLFGLLITSTVFRFDMRTLVYPKLILYVFYMVTGAILVFALSHALKNSNYNRIKTFLTKLGQYSLLIYLVHAPIYYTLESLLRVMRDPLVNAIVFDIVAISSAVVSPFLVEGIKRIKLEREKITQ
jgi:acyltransferase